MKTISDPNRCLYLGEMFCILNKKYSKTSSCIFYNVQTVTLYIPRDIFTQSFLPIFINDSLTKHYNLIMIDHKKRTIERFEPINISDYKSLNTLLEKFCKDYNYKYVYNKLGPQYMEMMYLKTTTMNCGFWVLSYLEKRIHNINKISQIKFLDNWMKNISKVGFDRYISEYKNEIINIVSKETVLKVLENKVVERIVNILPLDYYIYRYFK